MGRLAVAALTVGLILASGCADDADEESTAAVNAADGVADRCGPPDASARWVTLHGPGESQLSALVLGDGPVTAVYSHQTGTTGVCGFWPFAVWLAEEHGVRSVLLDHCGVGGSTCDGAFAEDRVGQLRLAIDWARSNGAGRLSLVGASLGGTTVTIAAAQTEVDAVVNLSGPLSWAGGLDALRAAPQVTEPTLLALEPYDPVATPAEYRRLRSALGSRITAYFSPEAGHGWELLAETPGWPFRPTPIADRVVGWLHGEYRGG